MHMMLIHGIRIKLRKPQLFQSTEVFGKVMLVLESHHFHHQMWCFTLNLFDKRVMRRIVLDEDENESKSENVNGSKNSRQELEDSDDDIDEADDD
jgi:rapamycin-insensitive companion of mTOR